MKKSNLNNQKGAVYLLLLIVAIGLIGFIIISSSADFKNKLFAYLFPKKSSLALAGQYYDTQVNVLNLFGQNKITESSRNIVNGKGIYHAAGVVVDKSSRPNKVYVVDSGNSRVLGYNGAGVCSNNASQSCTADSDCGSGNSCRIDGTKDPDIVIGQDNLTDGSCNRDNNLGFNKNPAANTLCLMGYPYNTNIAESWARHNPAVDGQGNFYIVDGFNNRVLKFNQPLSADKTDGKGDNVADFVIGQDDFTHNGRNRGTMDILNESTLAAPDNKSLYTMSSIYGWTCCGGVSVDNSTGDIWVTDSGNARVLRFPRGSKTADLVFGQTNFTTRGRAADCGPGITSMDKFCLPQLAKVDPDTGDIYVLDMYNKDLFEVRILVFHAPFTNGMSAARTIIANQGPNFFWRGLPAFHFQATGFEFNPLKAGPYSAGKLWVNEHETLRTVLLKDNGDVVTAIGATDINSRGWDVYTARCYNISDGFYLTWPGGAIGFDADNNIYLANESFHRLARYRLPYNVFTDRSGRLCLPDPSGGLFPGTQPNVDPLVASEPHVSSDDKLGEAVGLAVFNNQLIVQDEQRLKVWNDYLNKPMGAAPDIIVTAAPGTSKLPNRNLLSAAVDDHNRLWLVNEHYRIRIYQLPFVGNDRPIADNLLLIVGNDGYFDTNPSKRWLRQLWIYNNPLTKQTADGYIPLPIGATGELAIDKSDNLIVQDHTWGRVWVINPGLDPFWLVSTGPTPSPSPSPRVTEIKLQHLTSTGRVTEQTISLPASTFNFSIDPSSHLTRFLFHLSDNTRVSPYYYVKFINQNTSASGGLIINPEIRIDSVLTIN